MPSLRSWRTTSIGLIAMVALSTSAAAQDAAPSPAAAPDASAAPDVAEPTTLTPVSSLGIEQIVQAGDADRRLRGNALRKAVARIAPTIAEHRMASAGDSATQRVIELVLAARAAQAADDAASARALLALAHIAYRSGWTAAGTESVAFNDALRAEIAAGYAGVDGLALDPPEGLTDVCLQRRAEYVHPAHAPWECYGGDPKARVLRVSSELVDDAAAGTKDLYTGPREGADPAISIDEVTNAKDAYRPLKGKQLRKALAKVAPSVVDSWLESPRSDPAARVAEAVLTARAADEAGDTKAANAYMELGRIAYRRGWDSAGTGPIELNDAIISLVATGEIDGDGLDVLPPEGWTDICLQPRKRGPDFIVDQAAPWECAAGKGRVLRVPVSDIDPSKNGTDELYLGDR